MSSPSTKISDSFSPQLNAWGGLTLCPVCFIIPAIPTILPLLSGHHGVVWEFLGPSASQAGLGCVIESPAGAQSDSVHTEMAPGRAATVGY